MSDLAQQLKDNDIEPRPPPGASAGYGLPSLQYWSQSSPGPSWAALQQTSPPTASRHPHRERNVSRAALLSQFRPGCVGDNYLGVAGNTWLSSIEGTSLSLFGAKIDFSDFLPSDPENDAFVLTYQDFLDHAFGRKAAERPSLPPWEQVKQYANWYFSYVAFFVPILHKPDFVDLLQRTYHHQYEPNPTEDVIIHMVICTVGFQFSVRNKDRQMRDNAKAHFLYALTFVPKLIKGHNLPDLQALTLICVVLRGLQRPGPAWMFVHTVFGIAVELGLHRSVKAWQHGSPATDPHLIEMRKRVFWSLLVLHVNIGGKLGRPMPLRHEDFDIEIPEATADNLPEESELSPWHSCSFRAAPAGFKLTHIMLKTYSTIYAIRSTGDLYEANVNRLKEELDDFEASLPPELSGGPQTKDADHLASLYLKQGQQATRLLIHHPAILNNTASPKVASDNIDVCLDASSKLLESAIQIDAIKSLDTTIYYNMDYLSAIFVTLFAYYERRDTITSVDLQGLRQEMNKWLSITGEVGRMLGSGLRLQTSVRSIVDGLIEKLDQRLIAKTASAAVASAASSPPQITSAAQSQAPPQESKQQAPQISSQQQQQQQQPSQRDEVYQGAARYGSTYANDTVVRGLGGHDQSYREQSHHPLRLTGAPDTYPANAHYNYNDHPESDVAHYPSGAAMPDYHPPGAYPDDHKPGMRDELAAHGAMTQTHPQQHQPQSAPPGYHGPYNIPPSSAFNGPVAWRNFTDNMVNDMQTQGHGYSSALMAIEPKDDGSMGVPAAQNISGPASFSGMQLPSEEAGEWPMVYYSSGPPPR